MPPMMRNYWYPVAIWAALLFTLASLVAREITRASTVRHPTANYLLERLESTAPGTATRHRS